ncbi:hypothetical protein [Limosilactobacillus reuteri]|uniref:hypothetical protein n=1 Tax=Limosilactobacillus reuteri TaxID=1598 RepID=UPI000F012769|nr:hypothetical protein [Limosilactobacillus reuteri]MCC4436148.1 hypothetical protein [Limosilactobacillus reuteri]MCC4438069.1 hypothetical protein [Limosilactobacillus reuteri]MCC4441865.1 hypothetical protein [Limosilactobacillus reuteri]MCC4443876.1 hypothetical protein [Limosilactobacillus reuteri]MCC4445662.1 hypothetical protein [Limosilactobacillus reuteri]
MMRKFNKKIVILICVSVVLFILSSTLNADIEKLDNKELINRSIYCIALYLWTLWMYVGKHRFYKFFTVFTLIVYTFGFISFILVPLLNFQTICEIVLSGLGIIINVTAILMIHKERMPITNDQKDNS